MGLFARLLGKKKVEPASPAPDPQAYERANYALMLQGWKPARLP